MGEDVKENIGSYWDSLTGDDQKIWYTSECYSSRMYGITSVSPDGIEQLRTRDRRKAPKINVSRPGEKERLVKAKYIEGDSRYEILSSITYQQEFQYISIEQRNEPEDYQLSDMIMRALNLDDDNKHKDGEQEQIFTNSFELLKA